MPWIPQPRGKYVGPWSRSTRLMHVIYSQALFISKITLIKPPVGISTLQYCAVFLKELTINEPVGSRKYVIFLNNVF
jgi:hypothetical protein